VSTAVAAVTAVIGLVLGLLLTVFGVLAVLFLAAVTGAGAAVRALRP
jgi:hypothetical protein